MTEPSRTAAAVISPPEIRDGITVYICPRCGCEMTRRDSMKRHLETGWNCYLNYKRGLGRSPQTPPPPPPQNTDIESKSPAPMVTPPPVVTPSKPRSCYCARGSGSMFQREHPYDPKTTCPYGGPISRG